MGNTIATRIADFLKSFPPFNSCTSDELLGISQEVQVRHHEKEDAIFKTNETPHFHFYLVKEGAVGLYREVENEQILVDSCDEGDIFGLRALMQHNNYRMDAICTEESIIYTISIQKLQAILKKNSAVHKFLIASFASNTATIVNESSPLNLANDVSNLQTKAAHFTEIQRVELKKEAVTCTTSHTIREAAMIMTTHKVGSVVITKNNHPLGIITDKDLRIKVATGGFDIMKPVTEIMSYPVKTFPMEISITEAQIAMLTHKISHLCITEDGTVESPIVGVLSEHDIVVLHGNNPAVFIKEIKRSKTIKELINVRIKTEQLLENYLEKKVPIFFTTRIISALNESITQRIILFSEVEMNYKPPVKYSWMSLGSQGRREQLLMTDQDNALLFENVPAEQLEHVRSYFLILAKKITEKLHQIGYEYCPAEMMASNPNWCLSLNEWKSTFNNWIHKPGKTEILKCTIFFDIHHVYGEASLYENLKDSIFSAIKTYEIFLQFLAQNALKSPPPLSFFRQFLVEPNGEHKDHFDIKSRVFVPLIDAARLLSLAYQIPNAVNTIQRFEKLILLEPQNEALYTACNNAFKRIMRFRTIQGLKHNDSGRFIDLKELSKEDRLQLKSCFKSIKNIQDLITTRFQLTQLSS
ncbi:MAG: nucleotidyltransferase [Flavobacteriaceae bacterium]|nr:MAG: nucleotidyltransferase [Flavobacteriaceae bacterium]